jgi:hypothetical protein
MRQATERYGIAGYEQAVAPSGKTMEVAMIQRLVFIILGCAVLTAALALLCQFVFPDVAPYMPGEDAQLGWRREAAFLITALAWVAAEVSVVLSIALAAYVWKNRSTKIRSS